MKLTSTALPSSEGFRANRTAHLALLETAREAAEAAIAGGGPNGAGASRQPRQDAPARTGGEPSGPRQPVPGDRRDGGPWHVRRRGAGRGRHRGNWSGGCMART